MADDNESVRSTLRDILQSESGWEVCGEAENGEEAVRQARELSPDIIVMDIMMPKRNGFQATREIVRVAPQIRILIMTLYEFPELRRQAHSAGALGFVLKSDSGRFLIPAVRSLSEDKPYFPELL
ncbi:MAG: response regulator transcription factor [Candidatus Acidiferrales bacterium]